MIADAPRARAFGPVEEDPRTVEGTRQLIHFEAIPTHIGVLRRECRAAYDKAREAELNARETKDDILFYDFTMRAASWYAQVNAYARTLVLLTGDNTYKQYADHAALHWSLLRRGLIDL